MTFWTWYVIENNWDYGYVMVSTDSGNTWTNINGTLTTAPIQMERTLEMALLEQVLDGFRKNGPHAICRRKIILAFRFISDSGVNEEGWYIDDINITADSTPIYYDDAEIQSRLRH